MRIIIFLIVSFFTIAPSFAQQAILESTNGDSLEVYITSIDSSHLTTLDKKYPLREIEKITFKEETNRDIHLYYELDVAGVEVYFDDKIPFKEIDPLKIQVKKDPLTQFKESINIYRKSQQVGVGIQLAGVVLGAAGLYYDSGALTVIGLTTLTGGLVYQIYAGHHLNHLGY